VGKARLRTTHPELRLLTVKEGFVCDVQILIANVKTGLLPYTLSLARAEALCRLLPPRFLVVCFPSSPHRPQPLSESVWVENTLIMSLNRAPSHEPLSGDS
jgi:hypothetical protein